MWELSVWESGNVILAVNGEIHLEKCIRDLEKEYALVEDKYTQMMEDFR